MASAGDSAAGSGIPPGYTPPPPLEFDFVIGPRSAEYPFSKTVLWYPETIVQYTFLYTIILFTIAFTVAGLISFTAFLRGNDAHKKRELRQSNDTERAKSTSPTRRALYPPPSWSQERSQRPAVVVVAETGLRYITIGVWSLVGFAVTGLIVGSASGAVVGGVLSFVYTNDPVFAMPNWLPLAWAIVQLLVVVLMSFDNVALSCL
ncbi:hypothetical protein BJ742DRAFT_826208 [Cladochytrium replicatum]|nr:hypothetical protein BJ742DRAFT_826208 [Cladochytrium replicatum]